jgi:hypothetical protein
MFGFWSECGGQTRINGCAVLMTSAFIKVDAKQDKFRKTYTSDQLKKNYDGTINKHTLCPIGFLGFVDKNRGLG